jgi:transcriptional regulatory protein LevR
MATLPIARLLTLFEVLALETFDEVAQLSHFLAQVIHQVKFTWDWKLEKTVSAKLHICCVVIRLIKKTCVYKGRGQVTRRLENLKLPMLMVSTSQRTTESLLSDRR